MLGAGLGEVDTWRTWLVVLKAAFGLPLDEQGREIFFHTPRWEILLALPVRVMERID